MPDVPLTDFERELLDAVSVGGPRFGVATDTVDEQELEESPGREVVEATLRSLVSRGLVRTERSGGYLTLLPRDGTEVESRTYYGDWWIITDAGWAALGLLPPTRASVSMNPSLRLGGVLFLPHRIRAWRFRRGKPHLPRWYARLTGKEPLSRDE
jgi:hypothetical protein